MTNEERRPTGLLHTADELRQLIRNNPTLPLLSWLASWKMKSQMLVAFLLENEKARLSEND